MYFMLIKQFVSPKPLFFFFNGLFTLLVPEFNTLKLCQETANGMQTWTFVEAKYTFGIKIYTITYDNSLRMCMTKQAKYQHD